MIVYMHAPCLKAWDVQMRSNLVADSGQVKMMGYFLADVQHAGRVQSQVPLSYLRMDHLAAFVAPKGGSLGLGFAERAAAAAFVQSNCKVPSGRTEIISNLMSFGDVAIHSCGKCVPLSSRCLWPMAHHWVWCCLAGLYGH